MSGHGGPVLLSNLARALISDERFRVRSLGALPLKDFESPEPLFQFHVERLPDRFPPPRVTPKRPQRRLVEEVDHLQAEQLPR